MERKEYNIALNASPQKVWEVLWGDNTYPLWTTPFSESSQVETDWQEGSKVLFLDGKGAGMVSRIAAKKDHELMSFQHLGEVHNGVEDTESEKVKQWAGSYENYFLKSQNGKTELTVVIDIPEDYKDYFEETWPKALGKLKELSENP